MKRFVSNVLLVTLLAGLNACTQNAITPNKPTVKVVQTNIVELQQVESTKNNERFTYNKKYFQLIGVFKDTVENNLLLKDIIVSDMKQIIDKQEKTFQHSIIKYSYDEQINVCRNKVNLGQYGYFRNVIEKGKLLEYCFDDIGRKGKDWYTGVTYDSKISNNTLLVNITVGYGKNYLKTWQKIRIIKFNKKIYLMNFSSKKFYTEDVVFINTSLLKLIHNKKLRTLKPPYKVGFNQFSKLI